MIRTIGRNAYNSIIDAERNDWSWNNGKYIWNLCLSMLEEGNEEPLKGYAKLNPSTSSSGGL